YGTPVCGSGFVIGLSIEQMPAVGAAHVHVYHCGACIKAGLCCVRQRLGREWNRRVLLVCLVGTVRSDGKDQGVNGVHGPIQSKTRFERASLPDSCALVKQAPWAIQCTSRRFEPMGRVLVRSVVWPAPIALKGVYDSFSHGCTTHAIKWKQRLKAAMHRGF